MQQTGTQNNQLTLFSKQLAYMLAQITDGAARAIVRNEDTENGFESWRRLFNHFSLPSRARATNLLNEIIAFRLRQDHLESDLSDFIIIKNRHEKTTGVPLDNDLLITLIMQKTTGPLQQHLRLNVRNINTFTEALEIVYSYIKSRHLVVPSRNDGPVDMDIGALKGRKGYGKGKGKGKGGMYKGKGKGFKGKGMFKGKGKRKSKGFKGMKGKGQGQGCFICGDPNHLVTGLGLKMTGVTGPMTGLGVLRTGGALSSRVRVYLQVRKALRMSRRIRSRVSHRRM